MIRTILQSESFRIFKKLLKWITALFILSLVGITLIRVIQRTHISGDTEALCIKLQKSKNLTECQMGKTIDPIETNYFSCVIDSIYVLKVKEWRAVDFGKSTLWVELMNKDMSYIYLEGVNPQEKVGEEILTQFTLHFKKSVFDSCNCKQEIKF